MLDLTKFPDLLSSLNPFLGQHRSDATGVPIPEPKDSVEITDLKSNSRSATFDRKDKARLPKQDGFRPNYSGGQMSFGFEFNLSIEKSVSTQSVGERSFLKAHESASLFYQSLASSSDGALGSSFGQVRQYQTEQFYSRTRELSSRVEPASGQRLEQTSQKVVRAFEIDISLEFSFLGQFSRQSDTISDLDSGLFNAYLDQTDGFSHGQDMQNFFNDVDKVLQETEAFVQSTLESFFGDIGTNIGLSSEETGSLRSRVSQEVTAFFNDVDRFLSEAENSLSAFESAADVLPPIPEESSPEHQGDLVAA